MNEYDQSIKMYTNLCDRVINADTSRQTSIDEVMDKLMSIELQQDELQKQQKLEADKLVDLQWRSMRENLVFSGIKEPKLPREEYENVELSLRNFLRDEMDIDKDIQFDRIHRLGKFDYDQIYPRPIIAKFEKFKDKEFVRKAAPAALGGKHFGVNEQFPVEIENKRKLLYPEAKKARPDKLNKVRMVKDKLYVNGTEITVKEVDENEMHEKMNNETSRKQDYATTDENMNGARPKTRFVYNYQRGKRSRGHWRGRGSEWGQQSGYNVNRDSTWNTPSGSRQSYRGSNRDTYPNGAWNMPMGNYYSCLADSQNEETPRGKTTGKRQASSPVDMDVNVKKHAENSSDRDTYENPMSEIQEHTDTNTIDQTNIETDKSDNTPPPAGEDITEQSDQTPDGAPSENQGYGCAGGQYPSENEHIYDRQNKKSTKRMQDLNFLCINVCGLLARLRCPEFVELLQATI